MRKILLASSALVAAMGVSAASADVKIGLTQEFGYNSVSDGLGENSMFNAGEMVFSFGKVSDSGLSYTAKIEMDTDDANGALDESSLSISSPEIGTFTLGNDDHASGSFGTGLPGGRNMATGDDAQTSPEVGNTGLATHAGASGSNDASKITYISPSLSGFKVGASYSDTQRPDGGNGGAHGQSGEKANTSFGAKFSTDISGASVSVQALTANNGESAAKDSLTAFGANVSMDNGFSVAAARTSATNKTTPNDYKTTTTGFGIGYQINGDLGVAAGLARSEDSVSKNKLATTSYGLNYTIAPGLNFAVAFNQYKLENPAKVNSSEITASIQANF